MKLSIIIPAHNEEKRIQKTIESYHSFFAKKIENFELVIVLNGCTDRTLSIVKKLSQQLSSLVIINTTDAGKGLAIKIGFTNALKRANDLIGFVDADMATAPEAFYKLVQNVGVADGIIASRYMQGAWVYPPRPRYKRWGSKIVYEPAVKLLFNLPYYDLQCGAKLFKRETIETIILHIIISDWAIDLELLYLCKKYKFTVKEFPTVWYDQTDSKLTLRGGMRMLGSTVGLRLWHSPLRFLFRNR
ncbi:MAG: glycosyltransferase [Candidatus Babeliales bacterium]